MVLPFSGPKKQVRNYFPVEQGIPGAQTGMGLPENPDAIANVVPVEHCFPGAQIGMGSPENPDAIANAIPNSTTTNPSMILAFT